MSDALEPAPPVEVLFDGEGMSGNPPSSREKREELAEAAGRGPRSAGFKYHQGAGAGGVGHSDEPSPSVLVKRHTLAFNESNITSKQNASNPDWDDECHTLSTDSRNDVVIKEQCCSLAMKPIAMADDNAKAAIDEDMCGSLKVGGSAPWIAQGRMVVRRLTPMECERLQGFPDDFTKIPYRGKPAEECPDGPRYKAIGNSFAVPVVRWIGERIAMADKEGE